MAAIRICFLSLVLLLGFQVAQAQSSNDANPFCASGNIIHAKTQIVFTAPELAALGYPVGSVIDSICFQVYSRNSTFPYNNVQISYYFTISSFVFTWFNFAPIISPGGVVFLGTLYNSSLPPSGGILSIILSTPIVLSSLTNSLVVEMCWDTNIGNATDSIVSVQLPLTEKGVLRIRSVSQSTNGCALTATSNISNITEWRPNIFFCNPQPVAINSEILKNHLFTINAIVATSENILEVYFNSAEVNVCTYEIKDVIGKTVFKKANVKSKAGNNILQISHQLKSGIYFVSLSTNKETLTKKFVIN